MYLYHFYNRYLIDWTSWTSWSWKPYLIPFLYEYINKPSPLYLLHAWNLCCLAQFFARFVSKGSRRVRFVLLQIWRHECNGFLHKRSDIWRKYPAVRLLFFLRTLSTKCEKNYKNKQKNIYQLVIIVHTLNKLW